MLDRIDDYLPCLEDPERWAVATIVETRGSSPHAAGTSMAVSADLRIIGSLSGGCVEAAVASSAQDALSSGIPRLETYGPDGTLFGAPGLTCGGELTVLVEPLISAPDLPRLRRLARRDPRAATQLRRRIDVPGSGVLRMHEHRPDAPHLVLCGVHDHSVELASAALGLGWSATLIDARPAFAAAERVPDGAALHVGRPDRLLPGVLAPSSWTAVCVMTHHPEMDVAALDAALRAALRSTGGDEGPTVDFIGAMGSRRSRERRLRDLSGLGWEEGSLRRVRSPLGIDLGARSAPETAISMLAELIAARREHDRIRPLHAADGPVHPHRRSTSILHSAPPARRPAA